MLDYTFESLYTRARDAELSELYEEESGIDYGETIEAV